jgi:hypothetical protein
MAVTEDVARLILETKGTEALDDLRESLGYTRATILQLKGAYESGDMATEDYLRTGSQLLQTERDLASTIQVVEREQARMNAELLRSQGALDVVDLAMEDLERSSNAAAAAMKKVGTEAARAKTSTGGAAQAAIEFSRGVEDFATGGFLGVLNNIPRFFEGAGKAIGLSAGALAGWTTGISLAATAAYVLYRNWDSIAGLFESRNPIPAAADALERYKDELKAVNKELDDMKERTSLNSDELARFKKLTEEQADLEAKLAQERETQSNRKAHGGHASQFEQDAAKGFGKALDEAGGFEKVVERFTFEMARRTKAREDELPAIKRAIEEMFNKALAGDVKMINTVADIAKMDTTGVTGIFHKDIERYSPTAKLAAADKKKQDKLRDELNKQGHENELAMRAQQGKELTEELNRQGAQNEKEALKANAQMKRDQAKAAADAKRLGKAGRKKDKSEMLKEANQANKEMDERAKGATGLQAHAEAMIAQAVAGGRVRLDEKGQLSSKNFDQLTQLITREIQRANPGMKGFAAADMGRRVAANAEKGVSDKLLAHMGEGLSAQETTQAVLAETQTAVLQLAGRLRQVEARNRQLALRAAGLHRAVTAGSPTNLPAGEQN